MAPIRRAIASTGLEVFPVNLGGTPFGRSADRQQAFEVLDAYRSAGGNFLDTADGYGDGASESVIGAWLTSRAAHDEFVIATKVGKHSQLPGLRRENILAAVDASLRRLGGDRIDVYYAHYDDESVPLADVAGTFSSLVDAGKIVSIGVSNFRAERVEEWLRIAQDEHLHAPVAIQPHYNLVERAYEGELGAVAAKQGLAVMPYWALASGFLAGVVRNAAQAEKHSEFAARYLGERGDRVLEALDTAASNHHVTQSTVALAWLIAQPTVTAPVAGARTPEQVAGLVEAATLDLTPEELDALSAASR
ncbi:MULTISPECIES: aldo/keto reductase [Streptomyces]|uniref:aldo/keto reductase n=1 Tax=Streptomyces TaxID=1883 RepID=UPI00224D84EE|nr:aldo/keto reductase [Streptomyces sp. NBC_00038]MCX5555266.1 aldo/keto reductase [Streptomyces sp. NBC_00038]